jgi:hypothetical protein
MRRDSIDSSKERYGENVEKCEKFSSLSLAVLIRV